MNEENNLNEINNSVDNSLNKNENQININQENNNQLNNNISNQKNNKNTLKVILIVILTILLIAALSFIVYDKFINNDKVNSSTNTEENSNQGNTNGNEFLGNSQYSLINLSEEEKAFLEKYSILSYEPSLSDDNRWINIYYGFEDSNTICYNCKNSDKKTIKLNEEILYGTSFSYGFTYGLVFLTESGNLYFCDDECLQNGNGIDDMYFILNDKNILGLNYIYNDDSMFALLVVKTNSGLKKIYYSDVNDPNNEDLKNENHINRIVEMLDGSMCPTRETQTNTDCDKALNPNNKNRLVNMLELAISTLNYYEDKVVGNTSYGSFDAKQVEEHFREIFGPDVEYKNMDIRNEKDSFLTYDSETNMYNEGSIMVGDTPYENRIELYKQEHDNENEISIYWYSYGVNYACNEECEYLTVDSKGKEYKVSNDNMESDIAKLKKEGNIAIYKITLKKQSDGKFYVYSGEWQ